MTGELFPKREKRKALDLNIVPILDMLVTVIFFLLLSTSFMEYTKLTLPPSKTSVQSDPLAPPPLQPKLLAGSVPEGTKLQLIWSGAMGGEVNEIVSETEPEARRKALFAATAKIVKQFAEKFDKEKALQLGLTSKLTYQDLISIMDGARESIGDVVLISPVEAETRLRATLAPAGGGN